MAIFKNERGSWTCKLYYTDRNGKRRQKKKEGFKTKREAKAFEIEFLSATCKTSDIVFDKLVDDYISDCTVRLRPTTVMTKKGIINNKLLPYFSGMALRDISPAVIRSWQNSILSDNNNFSPTYIHTINTQLSAILNFAVKYYGIPSSPMSCCGSIGKRRADEMQFWTINEFNSFIKCVEDKMYKLLFQILFFTGLRIGELLALTPADFNIKTSTISVNKTFAVIKGEHIIQPPKTTKGNRKISYPQKLSRSVSDIINALDKNNRIFDMCRQSVVRQMDNACKTAQVKRIRIHDLRHSHASLLVELGVPPLVICERLGHESIQTTLNIYSHLYPNKDIEAVERLECLI